MKRRLDRKGQKKEPRQLPTFPLPYKSSIIGLEELNFRVRYGTGCDLFSIATQIQLYKLHRIYRMSRDRVEIKRH